jgi:signal transduction histidine kinase
MNQPSGSFALAGDPSSVACSDPVFAAQALQQLPAGVLIYDEAGTIRLINEQARSLLSLRDRQLVSVRELFGCWPHLEVQDHPERPGSALLEMPQCSGESKRFLGFRTLALRNGLQGMVGMLLQDITQPKLAQAEREDNLQLDSIERILPSLAHEIKNPLASIYTMVELLLEDAGTESLKEDLHCILSELRRITATLQRRGLALDAYLSQETDLVLALRPFLSLWQKKASFHGIGFNTALPSDLPCLLNPEWVCALLANLVLNAIEACRKGDHLALELTRCGGEIHLLLSDTGRGMEPEVLARAASPFFSTKSGGSGIGLALVRSWVRKAAGRFLLESTPGKGTSVSIHLAGVPS